MPLGCDVQAGRNYEGDPSRCLHVVRSHRAMENQKGIVGLSSGGVMLDLVRDGCRPFTAPGTPILVAFSCYRQIARHVRWIDCIGKFTRPNHKTNCSLAGPLGDRQDDDSLG